METLNLSSKYGLENSLPLVNISHKRIRLLCLQNKNDCGWKAGANHACPRKNESGEIGGAKIRLKESQIFKEKVKKGLKAIVLGLSLGLLHTTSASEYG